MSVAQKDIVIGFTVGVLSSITAVILWDLYKKKKGILEWGERQLINEVRSAIEGLKDKEQIA